MAKRPADAGAGSARQTTSVPATPREIAEHLRALQVVVGAITLGRKNRRLTLTAAQLNRVGGHRIAIYVTPDGFEARIEEPDPTLRHNVVYTTGAAQPLTAPQRGATTTVQSNND